MRSLASLTVNLDGERGKDCAFIDTNGDADFPVWLIRHGLAILPGQRSAVVTVSIQSTASGQTACVNWTGGVR